MLIKIKMVVGLYQWKLMDDVVNTEICSKCGTCVIVCPNDLIIFEDTPKLKDECLRKGNGMCYDVCPRVSSGGYQISIRENFKEEYYYGKGNVVGQDGGVVSTFLKYLLKNNKIDGAIVVGDDCWKPISMVVQNAKDIEKCAKSKYTVSVMDALKEAGKMGIEKVAVVGLPCQINGLRKLQYFPYLAKYDGELGKDGKPVKLPKIEYLIGLFCTEKFEYDELVNVLSKYNIDIKDVEKFDIKKGKLLVFTKDKEYKIPLSEIKECSGCKVCRDFDAKLSDVSIGCAGSPEGYSTVIIRTEKGEEIKNCIQLNDGVNLDNINKMRKLKMDRFKKEMERRKEKGEKLPYYWISNYGGIGGRADGTYFMRVRALPSGYYDAEILDVISDIAKKYNGRIKLTNRGGFEIHNIEGYYVEEIISELKKHDLITGSEGPLVRASLACPGSGNCKSGIINTYEICSIIEDNFKERPAPYKFKIAISGCPNQCVRPQIHDIGIVGVKFPVVNENCNGCGRCADLCKVEAIDIRGETSYTNYNVCIGCGKCIKGCPNEGRDIEREGYLVYVGGKSGREVIEGVKIDIMTTEEIISLIDSVLKVYLKYALKPQRERLVAVMDRVGKGKFMKEVAQLMGRGA